jgi:hypothetical protein
MMKNPTKNVEFVHNIIMLSLKIHLKSNDSESWCEGLLNLKKWYLEQTQLFF